MQFVGGAEESMELWPRFTGRVVKHLIKAAHGHSISSLRLNFAENEIKESDSIGGVGALDGAFINYHVDHNLE